MSVTASSERGVGPRPRAQAADAQRTQDNDAAAPAAPEAKLGRREVIGIIGGLALAMFLGALNQTIVATALAAEPAMKTPSATSIMPRRP